MIVVTYGLEGEFLMKLLQLIMNKRAKKMSTEKLKSSLEKACKKENVVKTVTFLYALGEKYLNEGKDEKALVYINRFDELAGSENDLYARFFNEEEQASEWIAMLGEKPSFAKEMRDWVLLKGEDLNDLQRIQ